LSTFDFRETLRNTKPRPNKAGVVCKGISFWRVKEALRNLYKVNKTRRFEFREAKYHTRSLMGWERVFFECSAQVIVKFVFYGIISVSKQDFSYFILRNLIESYMYLIYVF